AEDQPRQSVRTLVKLLSGNWRKSCPTFAKRAFRAMRGFLLSRGFSTVGKNDDDATTEGRFEILKIECVISLNRPFSKFMS
ncbi:hypothetical protein, partial [Rhizobium sp. NPDC090279]|uniref:hypothetical protein n=1 Tax=Rhizobium sp. NPDC090279 TaxID=3364499 RepID=UPI00383AA27C